MSDSEKVKKVREIAGISLKEASVALERMNGDVLLAVGYAQAKGLAVSIKGNREIWNIKRAQLFKEDYIKNKKD